MSSRPNDVDALEDGDDNTDEMPGVYRIEEPCREVGWNVGLAVNAGSMRSPKRVECRCIVECGRENDPRRQVSSWMQMRSASQ
ncbi:hypothetical protein TCAL_15474 [Tigriopus californicus]|uniref:Uncharacterized protein n=1 Tax=Tigriopus californicus TaxID=6832 RepID=A0A553PRJ3_TIGCA|nr:hypothetical protein TCAL_15474 [Tigriopus californicus]